MQDYLSLLFILTNFVLLESSRMGFCIKAVTVQGVVLAILPLIHEGEKITVAALVLCAVTLAIKGYMFPKLLNAAIDRAKVKREVEPIVGYSLSLIIGVAMLVFAFWMQVKIPLAGAGHGLLLPASFFAISVGFFVTIARRKAISQILGYLALENGIFAFGAGALPEHPWMLEMGILLDVFVAVFIMGVAVFQISREFSHMDADRLSTLRDPAGDL